MQLRTKLTLQFILITATIFTMALLFIYAQFRQHTENEFFSVLESKARMTAEMVLRHEEELKPITEAATEPSPVLPYGENIFIFDASDQLVFALNPAGANMPGSQINQIRDKGNSRFLRGKLQAFGLEISSPSGKNYVVISEGSFDNSKLIELRNILIFTFFLIIGGVATGGWFFARQAMRPVFQIVKAVDEIRPSDLSRRVGSYNKHNELSHLVATFNRLLDRIEHAFRMQRSFISNVSHELKNPLAAMDAQLQLARQKERSAGEYRSVLESLHDDVREITDTAEKLLQLARVHSDAAHIEFSKVRLDEIMLQTRDAVLKVNPEYSIVFEIQDMPEQEEHLFILGNEPLLRTALINLFDNGCKFSPDKKVNVRIRFRDSGKHEVEIIDNGPGIPEEDLQRIFEPFFRSPQHSNIKGSGIGLSLVQSILKLHGVVVDVFSAKNHGATFKLSFPVTQ